MGEIEHDVQEVALYLRKSRAEANEATHETLKRHQDRLLDLARRRGYVVTDVFTEVVSGESLYARPQMLAMLQQVEDSVYDAVLVMDIDRLSRGDMKDQGMILEAFKLSSTKIITPEKIYNLNDDLDEELTEFKTFISRREYKQITKRLQRGLQQSILDGCYMANAPYGYRRAYLDKQPTLEINPEEAKFVRMMFDLYCDGIGCHSIAQTVHALGARPHRAEQFSRNSVLHILKNPTFTGKVVWNRKKHIRKRTRGNETHITLTQPPELWTVVDGLHPAIISQDQFDRVQQLLQSRSIPSSHDGSVKSPLTGIVKCRKCGKNMQRMVMKGTPYLLCNTTGCCAAVRLAYVEGAVLHALHDTLTTLKAEAQQEEAGDTALQRQLLQTLDGEEKKVQNQKARLHTLLEQGVYDVPTYRERMQSVTDLLDAISGQRRALTDTIERQTMGQKKQTAQHMQTALEVYHTVNVQGKNRLLKALLSSIEYEKEKKTKPREFSIYLHLHTSV